MNMHTITPEEVSKREKMQEKEKLVKGHENKAGFTAQCLQIRPRLRGIQGIVSNAP